MDKRALLLTQTIALVCSMQYYNEWRDDFVPSQQDINFVQSFVDAMNITDDLDRLAIAVKLKYCPMSNLCSVSTTSVRNYFKDIYDVTKPCCAPCSCDIGCSEYGNCCPDMYRNISENWHVYVRQTKYKCISTRYMPDYATVEQVGDVWSVAKCVNNTDEDIVRNCENVSRTFAPDTHVPVTDSADGTIYRNFFCAVCNNVPEIDISGWTVKLNCTGPHKRDYYPPYYDNIGQGCFLEYITPVDVPEEKRCPSTDYSIRYEQLSNEPLGKLCLLFQTSFNFKYRNVYCFDLLNPDNEIYQCRFSPPLLGPTGLYDYSYLLDFQTLRKWKTEANPTEILSSTPLSSTENCSSSEIADNYQMKCLPVVCDENQEYRNDICESKYKSEPPVFYHIMLRLSFMFSLQKHYIRGSVMNNIVESVMAGLNHSIIGSFLMCSTEIFVPDTVSGEPFVDVLYVKLAVLAPSGHASLITEATKLQFPTLTVDDDDYFTHSLRMTLSLENAFDCHGGDPSYCASKNSRFLGFQKVYSKSMISKIYSVCYDAKYFVQFDLKGLNICPKVCFGGDIVKHVSGLRKGVRLCLAPHSVCFQSGEYVRKGSKVCVCLDTYRKKTSEASGKLSSTVCNKVEVSYTRRLTSFIGTIVSCFSLIIVIFVYFSTPSLRSLPGKLNLTLSCFLFLAQLLFQFGIGATKIQTICKVLGLLIHFFWLLVFFWMNTCSFHMARAFVFNLENIHLVKQHPHTYRRYTMYSIGMPCCLILVNTATSLAMSDFDDVGYGGCTCYISSSTMVLFTLFIPAFLILVSNFFMFSCVIFKIRGLASRSHVIREKRSYLLIYCKMSTITGISWVAMFLNEFFRNEVLGYISTLSASLLGVYILIAFLCNKRTLVHVRGHFSDLMSGATKKSNSSGTASTRM